MPENLVWFEKPEDYGFRFVGLAHDVGRAGISHVCNAVDHTGWFTDEYQDRETITGVVYQLPARDGRAVYVVGHDDKCNPGSARLDIGTLHYGERCDEFDKTEELRDVARAADGYAESAAESEREYNAAWDNGRQCMTAFEEMESAWATYRLSVETLREAFAARHQISDHATRRKIIDALISSLRGDCSHFRDMREEFHNKLSERPSGRYDVDNGLVSAWYEGYQR